MRKLSLLLAAVVSTPLFSAVDYAKEIKPLLQAQCVKCHGARTQKSDLRLDTAAHAMKGGKRGAALISGKGNESLIVQAMRGGHGEIPTMPYKRPPVDAEQIALIARWIDEGAQAPANEVPSDDRHWAFIAPQKPKVDDDHAIDTLIEARLREMKLEPLAEAAPATLLRRVSLDLIGLPPSVDEVHSFEQQCKAQGVDAALDTTVTRLLSSPHYGERWARWWLDQARYADSNGYSIDAPRSIWPYRDWVVNAFNSGMPFNQFTIEQLAGDLLPNPAPEQHIATGFHRNTQVNMEGGIDPEQFRVESVVDRVGTTATVWMGLTLACAQCHDHKFDPLSQREFYGMYAFFNSTQQDGHAGTKTSMVTLPPVKDEGALEQDLNSLRFEIDRYFRDNSQDTNAEERKLTPEQLARWPKPAQAAQKKAYAQRSLNEQRAVFVALRPKDKRFASMNKQLIEREKGISPAITTLTMEELATPRDTRLFIKGDFTRPADLVPRLLPAVLPPLESKAPTRLDLARWIVDRQHPLTARVLVNRLWQQFFGKGLVVTENDFGTMGSAPTHPALLDWLAVTLMEKQWDVKAMQRAMVMSKAYRRSANVSAGAPQMQVDANNAWLWRQSRLRLDAELIRDVGLSVSGLLVPKLGGPPVYPPIPDGVMSLGQVKRVWPLSKGPDRYRRGLYTFVFRATPPPSMSVFDAPDGFSTCTRRLRSNTPLQALTVLNDTSFDEFAQALGKLLHSLPGTDSDRVQQGFQRCTARLPDAEEQQLLLAVLNDARAAGQGEDHAYRLLGRVLLNLDETLTRE